MGDKLRERKGTYRYLELDCSPSYSPHHWLLQRIRENGIMCCRI